jgi:hypothetical protein
MYDLCMLSRTGIKEKALIEGNYYNKQKRYKNREIGKKTLTD